jgi:hypothetical protein
MKKDEIAGYKCGGPVRVHIKPKPEDREKAKALEAKSEKKDKK